MRQDIELLNCLSGISETYASPPWRLEGITAHKRGCLIRLVHVDGTQLAVPVLLHAEDVLRQFATW